MRTTVTIDEKLIREIMKITGAKTKTAAVTLALQEQLRKERIEKLRSLLGKVDIDAESLKELRELEIDEASAIAGEGACATC